MLALCCAACTPHQVLLGSLVPDGAASVLLGHLQHVPDANRQRVSALEQQGDWRGLVQFADANITKDPFSAEWRLVGGYAYAQLGDHRQAAAYFGELVRLSPDDAAGYHFLAESQRALGDPQRAVVTLERALRVVHESAQTHRLLGDAYADLQRDGAALASYRRALHIAPQLEPAWWGLGQAALRAGRMADAREAARALAQMQSPRAALLERQIAQGS